MSDKQRDETPKRTEVDEKMDRVYPNRHMTAEERPEIPESGIEARPDEDQPQAEPPKAEPQK